MNTKFYCFYRKMKLNNVPTKCKQKYVWEFLLDAFVYIAKSKNIYKNILTNIYIHTYLYTFIHMHLNKHKQIYIPTNICIWLHLAQTFYVTFHIKEYLYKCLNIFKIYTLKQFVVFFSSLHCFIKKIQLFVIFCLYLSCKCKLEEFCSFLF